MKKIWKIFVGVIFLAVCSGCGIKKEQKKTIEDTKEKIYRECEMLAEGYRNIYENAVKENALYELSTIQKSMDYFGKYGYAVIDSYNQLDMVQSIKVDDFLKKAEKEKNGKTTIFQVIAGDHFIRYDLKTKQGKIDVEVSSFKWKEDTWQETYYHEFRANSWKYTENGHFFIEEYHPAGYDGPSGYRDFRVAPLNKKCRELNRKYILPFGYTLNKLFTSNWSEKNYDGINFYDVFDRLLSMEEKTDEFKEGKTYEIPSGIFFKYLCRVERKMRSSISYHFCKKHGERQEEYLNSNNYGNIPKNKNGITKLIKMLDMMANKNKDNEYLVYQRNKYHNIPLWVIMNTLTFGQISKMFEFLPQNMQGAICQDFGNVKKNEMIKYLKVLTLYRNVCAHNERLFSYHTYIDIPDTLLHKKLGISKNGSKYIYGKNDLFSVVITFRYLLPKTDFLLFKKQLLHIFYRYEKRNSNLKLNDLFEYMGFPINWKEITKFRKI